MTATASTRDYTSNIHIATKEFSSYGDDNHRAMTKILPPNRVYTCKVDYPFNTGFTFKVKVGENGMTLKGFVTRLSNAYKKHYEKIENDEVDDGYWHGIDDLYLEKTLINDESLTIEVWIGS
jgi:hypothetical protein